MSRSRGVDELLGGSAGAPTARPSGTGNICKSWAETVLDQSRLDPIVAEACAILDRALGSSA